MRFSAVGTAYPELNLHGLADDQVLRLFLFFCAMSLLSGLYCSPLTDRFTVRCPLVHYRLKSRLPAATRAEQRNPRAAD